MATRKTAITRAAITALVIILGLSAWKNFTQSETIETQNKRVQANRIESAILRAAAERSAEDAQRAQASVDDLLLLVDSLEQSKDTVLTRVQTIIEQHEETKNIIPRADIIFLREYISSAVRHHTRD